MNYLSLLKPLFIFLSLALYVSVAFSQEETVIITVTENGEVTIVRTPSRTLINLKDLTEEDIIKIIWTCDGLYHEITFRYVDGHVIAKRLNGEPVRLNDPYSFEQFIELYIKYYLDKIKEHLQCMNRDRSKKEGFCKKCEEPKLSTEIISFVTTIKESKIYLEWITGTEKDNAGSQFWRD
jgi:hypothetical protein